MRVGEGLLPCQESRLEVYATHPKPRFTLKTGTIFEDSPSLWKSGFRPCGCCVNCKNGISSYEVHRALGVTQKTAWFMLHRIRLAMQEGDFRKLDRRHRGGRNLHRRQGREHARHQAGAT